MNDKEQKEIRWNDNLVKEIFRDYAVPKIKGLIDIQKKNGNYNNDEFMYGMLIGLETAYYSLLGEEAKFTEHPLSWLRDNIPEDFVPEVVEGMRPMTAEEAESLNEFCWNELKENKIGTSS